MKKHRILLALAFVATLALGATAIGSIHERPSFDLPFNTVDGRQVKLNELKGKVILINFWATWCPPCRQEIPALVAAHKKYEAQGFTVLGVDFMERMDEKELKPFVKELGINYPVLTAEPGLLFDLAKELGGVFGLPTSYLVDRNGKVVKGHTGAVDDATLKNMIEPLL